MNKLEARVTAYLSGGGLFNPELANHDAVRDLIIDLRAALATASGCPCTVEGIEPCSYACSCANPVMSGGCGRCAKYGSLEQRQTAARRLVALATARKYEQERLAKIADQYPDTLESVGDAGSGKFKAVSKLAKIFRNLTDEG